MDFLASGRLAMGVGNGEVGGVFPDVIVGEVSPGAIVIGYSNN